MEPVGGTFRRMTEFNARVCEEVSLVILKVNKSFSAGEVALYEFRASGSMERPWDPSW
jgi:hypothetical protein